MVIENFDNVDKIVVLWRDFGKRIFGFVEAKLKVDYPEMKWKRESPNGWALQLGLDQSAIDLPEGIKYCVLIHSKEGEYTITYTNEDVKTAYYSDCVIDYSDYKKYVEEYKLFDFVCSDYEKLLDKVKRTLEGVVEGILVFEGK
jgi:hypothetical protein